LIAFADLEMLLGEFPSLAREQRAEVDARGKPRRHFAVITSCHRFVAWQQKADFKIVKRRIRPRLLLDFSLERHFHSENARLVAPSV